MSNCSLSLLKSRTSRTSRKSLFIREARHQLDTLPDALRPGVDGLVTIGLMALAPVANRPQATHARKRDLSECIGVCVAIALNRDKVGVPDNAFHCSQPFE